MTAGYTGPWWPVAALGLAYALAVGAPTTAERLASSLDVLARRLQEAEVQRRRQDEAYAVVSWPHLDGGHAAR